MGLHRIATPPRDLPHEVDEWKQQPKDSEYDPRISVVAEILETETHLSCRVDLRDVPLDDDDDASHTLGIPSMAAGSPVGGGSERGGGWGFTPRAKRPRGAALPL